MAGILDDLKGILSPAEFEKLQGNAAIATRISRGDELRSYYDGDEVVGTPATRTGPAGMFDLSSVERMLDSKLGKINEIVDARVQDVVKQRGDELYNNVRAGVRNDALQLVKIYTRHQQAAGKDWDDAEEVKFNDFLKANNEAVKTGGGKRYQNITEAYNDYIAPVVTERTIESEVTKRVSAKTAADSGRNVPGTTPPPATNSNIRHFMKRNANGGVAETTGAGRAAAALDRIQARQQEMAS
jgi:hypothetical protein